MKMIRCRCWYVGEVSPGDFVIRSPHIGVKFFHRSAPFGAPGIQPGFKGGLVPVFQHIQYAHFQRRQHQTIIAMPFVRRDLIHIQDAYHRAAPRQDAFSRQSFKDTRDAVRAPLVVNGGFYYIRPADQLIDL